MRLRPLLALALTFALPAAAGAQSDRHVGIRPTILKPSTGQTLRAGVHVEANADPAATEVLFEWSRNGQIWNRIGRDTDPVDGWSWIWNTNGFEGRALIRVTDSLGGQSHIRVRIDNTAPDAALRARAVFSPNGDGRLDAAGISVGADEDSTLTLQVVGPGGKVVWTAAREVRVTARSARKFAWNGYIWDGSRRGRDGVYTVRAIVRDAVGNTSTATKEVLVDTKPPTVLWRSLQPDRLASGPISLTLGVADVSGAVHTAATIYTRGGAKVASYRGRWWPSGPAVLTVTPPDELRTGEYDVAIAAVDRVGNSTVTDRRSFLIQRTVTARIWGRFENAGKRAALTFDDCFVPSAWASILDTLRRYNVKATFFCPGQAVLANKELALRTVREGHAIGSHGWDHAYFPKLSYGAALQRLIDDREVWWNLAHVSPLPLFRPPYGAYNATTLAAAGQAGYSAIVLWDVDPLDWKSPGSAAVEARIVGSTRPGSIDLMHTVTDTAGALPNIITRLHALGYQLLTLPELADVATPTAAYWPTFSAGGKSG